MALAGVIVAELGWARGEPFEVVGEHEPVWAASTPELPAPPPRQVEAWAAAILARPLFAPGRRPPPPPLLAVAAPPPLPELTGIILSPACRCAIFAVGDKSLTIDEGGRVAAWRLQAVSDGTVTLLGPDGPRILALTFKVPRVSERTSISSAVAAKRPRTHTRT